MTATLDSSRLFSFAPSMKESAIPAHAVDDPKPKLRKAVRVWLSDGSRFFAMWTAPNGGVPKVSLPPSNGSLKNGKRKRKSFAKNFRTQKTQLDPLRRISVLDPQ
jgi:hypothetical protein